MKGVATVVAVLVVAVLAALGGLTAGINLNPQSTVKFVPDWGSVGDWVSGLGALLAVAVTLWLSEKQRRENTERLVIEQVARGEGLSIKIISSGNRPSLVTGLYIGSTTSDQKINLSSSTYLHARFPVGRIDFGEMASVLVLHKHQLEIAQIAEKKYNKDFTALLLVVTTSLGRFSVPLDSIYVSYMRHCLEVERNHQETLALLQSID